MVLIDKVQQNLFIILRACCRFKPNYFSALLFQTLLYNQYFRPDLRTKRLQGAVVIYWI